MRTTTGEATVETSKLGSGLRCWLSLGVVCAAVLIAAAPAAAAPFAYVTDFAGSVSAYDAGPGALSPLKSSTVGAGSGAIGAAVTPDGTSVYVPDENADTVSEYDVAADGTLRQRRSPP
jgi:DNA-binding beta-propeller fold protein YncE